MKKKILIAAKNFNIEDIRKLKEKFIITYKDTPDVDIVIDDYNIYIKYHEQYKYPYRHMIDTSNSVTISFIADTFEKTCDELTAYRW